MGKQCSLIANSMVEKWEVMKQVMEFYRDVEPFLRENNDLSPATREHLMNIFDNPDEATDLELELAALIDAGAPFVSATYYLVGDGPLVFSCYKRLSTVAHSVGIDAYPNVEAMARCRADGNMAVYN